MIASKANREGVAERVADPAVQKRLDVDLALITDDDELRRDVDLTLVNTAKPHDATTLYLLQTVPGIGKMLRLVRRDAIQAIERLPRVQDVVSSGRLVTWAKESASTRHGTSGTKIGNAHLKGACSEAAVLCLRDQPAAQTYLARLEKKHDPGKAVTRRAQPWARAVSDMLPRPVACERATFCPRSGRGADEPGASRDTPGLNRQTALNTAACLASVNAKTPLGHPPLSPAR